jgi:hypothetical protein
VIYDDRALEIIWSPDSGALQVAKQLLDQYDIDGLKAVIISKLELIRLGNNQATFALHEDSELLQAADPASDGFDRKAEKSRKRGARDTLFDVVRLDGVQASEFLIKLQVPHDADDVGIQDRVDDQQIERIKILVVAKHLADRTQHIGERMPRQGSDEIGGLPHAYRYAQAGFAFLIMPANFLLGTIQPYPKWAGDNPFHVRVNVRLAFVVATIR